MALAAFFIFGFGFSMYYTIRKPKQKNGDFLYYDMGGFNDKPKPDASINLNDWFIRPNSCQGQPRSDDITWAVIPADVKRLNHVRLEYRYPRNHTPECPDFMEVDTNLSIAACRNVLFQDPKLPLSRRPPSLFYSGDVFRLQNVVAHFSGVHYFNETHHFEVVGCNEGPIEHVPFNPAQAYPSIRKAVSVPHVWGSNFYHRLIETLPRIFLAQFILEANPDAWIVSGDGEFPGDFFSLIGLNPASMRIFALHRDNFVHIQEAYVPLTPPCGVQSPSVMKALRWEIVHHNLNPKQVKTWTSLSYRNATREDLKIVLIWRREWARRFARGKQIVRALERRYGKSRLHVIYGDEPPANYVSLFHDTHLFIGVHGAGLSYMLFLPPKATMLEVWPVGYPIPCYKELAKALDMDFYRINAEGDRWTPTNVSETALLDKVIGILGF